jgi:hypothetical protein
MVIYWLMFWIFIGIASYLCYCWGAKRWVYPKFRRNPYKLKRVADNYCIKPNRHPPACTCVDCNDIRLGKTLR